MNKKKIFIIAGGIGGITVILSAAGIILGKDSDEKMNGLSSQYDISPDGAIAYVNYTDGEPALYLQSQDGEQADKLAELENDKVILDPAFSRNGDKLAFIATGKDPEEELLSTVHLLELPNGETSELFSISAAVTEIEFSAEDESVFYLSAEIFDNYSPIASKQPHDFDLHEFNLATGEHKKHTELEKYSMQSMKISGEGSSVFVQMPDDAHVQSAEDIFNDMYQRVFEIPLDDPNGLQVVSDPELERDIYTFELTPEENEIIYQAISDPESSGIFQYELFRYNRETKEHEQLTDLKKHAGDPVIAADRIYFTTDVNFGKGDPEYELYEMNMDGTEARKVQLMDGQGEGS